MYCIVQVWLSYGIVLEIYPYMKWGFLLRIWSFFAAIAYNMIYFFGLFGWATEILMLPTRGDEFIEEMGFLDVFLNMLFIYNSIQHSPICFVNMVIIAKET